MVVPPKQIQGDNSNRIRAKYQPYPQAYLQGQSTPVQETKARIDSMLEHGFIRYYQSHWGTPILLVLKKHGNLQFYLDYRWMNKKTIQNCYSQIPRSYPQRLKSFSLKNIFSKHVIRTSYELSQISLTYLIISSWTKYLKLNEKHCIAEELKLLNVHMPNLTSLTDTSPFVRWVSRPNHLQWLDSTLQSTEAYLRYQISEITISSYTIYNRIMYRNLETLWNFQRLNDVSMVH